MSIVLVVFPGVPKPTNEAIQADKELNETIEKRVEEIFETTNVQQFSDVLYTLMRSNIDGLPPGGGLASKYVNFVHS